MSVYLLSPCTWYAAAQKSFCRDAVFLPCSATCPRKHQLSTALGPQHLLQHALDSQLEKGSVNPFTTIASVPLFRAELGERERSTCVVVPCKGQSASFQRGHKSFMLDHCIHRWKRPEHDPKRDQRGNGDPVTHVHGGVGLMGLMICCCLSCTLCSEEVTLRSRSFIS